MLTSDMCLAFKLNPALADCKRNATADCKSYVKSGSYLNATYGPCCAWPSSNFLVKSGIPTGLTFCGAILSTTPNPKERNNCCKYMPSENFATDCDNLGPP